MDNGSDVLMTRISCGVVKQTEKHLLIVVGVSNLIDKSDVRAIHRYAKITVEKVLQVEHRREPHRAVGEVSNKFCVTGIDCLQQFSLVLDTGPTVS